MSHNLFIKSFILQLNINDTKELENLNSLVKQKLADIEDLEDNILVLLLEHHDRMSKILAPDGSVGYVYTDCLKEVT